MESLQNNTMQLSPNSGYKLYYLFLCIVEEVNKAYFVNVKSELSHCYQNSLKKYHVMYTAGTVSECNM